MENGSPAELETVRMVLQDGTEAHWLLPPEANTRRRGRIELGTLQASDDSIASFLREPYSVSRTSGSPWSYLSLLFVNSYHLLVSIFPSSIVPCLSSLDLTKLDDASLHRCVVWKRSPGLCLNHASAGFCSSLSLEICFLLFFAVFWLLRYNDMCIV
jgi:hypothetical protein